MDFIKLRLVVAHAVPTAGFFLAKSSMEKASGSDFISQ